MTLSAGGQVLTITGWYLTILANKIEQFANSGYGIAIGYDDEYGVYIALGDERYYQFYGYASGVCRGANIVLEQFVDSTWGLVIESMLTMPLLIMFTRTFLGFDKESKIKGELDWEPFPLVILLAIELVYTLYQLFIRAF